MEKSLKEKTDIARAKHDQAIRLITTIGIASFELARLLYEIKKEKLYRYAIGEGADTWQLYCESLGISVSTADKLVDRYKVFVIQHKVPIEELASINVANLQAILPVVKRDPAKLPILIEMAKNSRTIDIARYVAQLKLGSECNHPNVEIKAFCTQCKEPLTIPPKIIEQIKKALL
jgi:hypothetical protein